MRILMNAKCLLLYNYSNCFKANRHFRWYLPVTTQLTGSNVYLNTGQFRSNICRKLNVVLAPNSSRLISSSSSIATKSRSDDSERTTETLSMQSPPPLTEQHPDGVTIYTGKFTRQIVRVKMFSLTTSAMGLVAQPVLWHKGLEVSGTGLGVLLCSVAGLFTFVTPVLLHLVTKKYVIDIKYNKQTDEYTCMTVSFFLFENKIKFKIEDIAIPEIETMFSSMLIGPNKEPVFVDAASFIDTHHYARFMGYDKPLDFRLDTHEIEASTKSTSNNASDMEKSMQQKLNK